MFAFSAALLSALGCYPGSVETSDGTFKLRTAMHLVDDSASPRTVFLLSDSQLSCEISSENPGEVSTSMLQQLAGIGREGAQTILMRATKLDGGDWPGEYGVQPYDSVLWSGRWSEAIYFRVDESTVSSNDVLTYYYEATEFTQLTPDDNGELTLGEENEEGEMKGSFDFRDVKISGDFTSTLCPVQDGTLRQIIRNLEDYLQDASLDPEQPF